MTTGQEVALSQMSSALMEKVVVGGDLSQLSPAERMQFYAAICESVGLNPLARPFQYLVLNNKLVLYADKNCAEQLRSLRSVSVLTNDPKFDHDLGLVMMSGRASMADGRVDSGTAAVSIKSLSGDALANAIMKCETKLKRRLTLSICGLGMMDDSEVDSVPDARRVTVDHATGEVLTPIDQPRLAAPQNSNLATQAQRDKMFGDAHRAGWSDEDLKAHVMTTYDVTSSKELTKAQLSELLTYIAAGSKPAKAPMVQPEQGAFA